MPTISIRFPGGHYHATPWGSSPNEGVVEWPPSPWRLLRALLACGYAKLEDWQSGQLPEKAKSLVLKLAGSLPSYKLPEASGAHTRHYMPIAGGKTTLVLDTRAVCKQDTHMRVRWDVELDPDERDLLRVLVERLNYLGRAESWVECSLLEEDLPIDRTWVRPCLENDHPGPSWEQITLLAPVPPDEYERWRLQKISMTQEQREQPAKKISKAQAKKTAKQGDIFPVDLLACLQAETGWLQKVGWSQPPGSRQVLYWRPADAIRVFEPAITPRQEFEPAPFALLAVSSSARSRSVLPLRERSLAQADLLHRTLVSLVNKFGVSDANELVGLDNTGKPMQGHRHAHLLPLTLLHDDNHIDHILVWAPSGLGDGAQSVLRAVRKTYMKGGVGELSVRFAGCGDASEMMKIDALSPFIGSARVWQSYTPLVLPRYRKTRGRNTPDGQIRDELRERGLPEPSSIEWLHDESIAMRHFVRVRRSGQAPPENFGYALRITFAEPVAGPLCLGYASHFGLGLFRSIM